MIRVKPISFADAGSALAVEVQLPKTNLIAITTDVGYIMCGALDVALLNERLADRKIVAGRAVGVKTWEELLAAPLESVTHQAEAIGITAGMSGTEALQKLLASSSLS